MRQAKDVRERLDAAAYAKLRQQVLERDSWRCQLCGSRRNLDVHHIRYRSRQGSDAMDNLITLCRRCHRTLHNQPRGSPRKDDSDR